MHEELERLIADQPHVAFEVKLDPRHQAEFEEHGFTHLERITSDEELEWLRRIYDWLFEQRAQAVNGGYFDLSRPYESAGNDLLPQILMPEALVTDLRKTAFWRNGHALAATLLEADAADLRGWGHMIRKPEHIGATLPWHQDEAYWDPAFDYRALGSWLTLDPATTESGCLAFIPRSHRGDVWEHRHIDNDPNIHGLVTDDVDESTAVEVPVPAGGAVFHHCRVVHCSGANTADQVRRAWANEWQLPPVERDVPVARPWVVEGKRAWESRTLS